MVYIVGLGPGSREYLLLKALEILESAEVVIGFSRAFASLEFISVEKVVARNLEEILNYINLNRDKNIAVAASGDPCFYGISEYLRRNYDGNFEIIPGISSFQYLMTKLNKSWNGSYLGSLHGRMEDFVEKVKAYNISIWLTDRTNSPDKICKSLKEEGLLVRVYIGENLSYMDERITIGTPVELMNREFSDLSVVVIENDLFKGSRVYTRKLSNDERRGKDSQHRKAWY